MTHDLVDFSTMHVRIKLLDRRVHYSLFMELCCVQITPSPSSLFSVGICLQIVLDLFKSINPKQQPIVVNVYFEW